MKVLKIAAITIIVALAILQFSGFSIPQFFQTLNDPSCIQMEPRGFNFSHMHLLSPARFDESRWKAADGYGLGAYTYADQQKETYMRKIIRLRMVQDLGRRIAGKTKEEIQATLGPMRDYKDYMHSLYGYDLAHDVRYGSMFLDLRFDKQDKLVGYKVVFLPNVAD